MVVMEGGFRCRRIRFAAEIAGSVAYLCHCRMGRRATGGVSVALKSVPKNAVRWTGAAPDYYQSSRIAQRGFCRVCGMPLSVDYPDSASVDLTVGAFDDPGFFVPASHCSAETMLRNWLDTSELSEEILSEQPATRERWLRASGAMPDG